jgi:hypothetical protein
MTSYDTQKFNLHHGSFGGAKGLRIGAWTISTSAFMTSSNGLALAFCFYEHHVRRLSRGG